jgi:hypothetical protein
MYSEGALNITVPDKNATKIDMNQELKAFTNRQETLNRFGAANSTATKLNILNTGLKGTLALIKGVRKGEADYQIKKGRTYYIKLGPDGGIKATKTDLKAKAEFENPKAFLNPPDVLEEDRKLPIPEMSLDKEIKRRAAIAKQLQDSLAIIQEKIKSQIDELFKKLKEQGKLAHEVEPQVYVGVEEGGIEPGGMRMRYNLRATYSYEALEKEGVKAELAHYPSGAYQIEKSKAALATADAMKETINYYLSNYFEPNSEVKIRIVGSADAVPIRGDYRYLEEYGVLDKSPYYLTDDYGIVTFETKFDSTEVKTDSVETSQAAETGSHIKGIAPQPEERALGKEMNVTMKKSDKITRNEDLAYLRTCGIRNYMKKNIPALDKTNNTFTHQAKIEQGAGGKFRKVVMELLIEDILRDK